ncbi:MAG TPA: methyltransferase domain-containing protein [Candidatus Limnocylindria bacterium]|nr:methyltransferase domain-containing protein [Candidatus Limnocylindria bacterium]
MTSRAAQFVGSIPEHYHQHLVPAVFEPYADDLGARLRVAPGDVVLEVACGTGVLTRLLVPRLQGARLVATDLNENMIEVARRIVGDNPHLTWRVADGTALPFDEAMFEAVVCQFGVMFYPDKLQGMREARRVLRPKGAFLFNVWDDFSRNAFGRIAHETITRLFPVDPPKFYLTPFGFNDQSAIRGLLSDAGFRDVKIEQVVKDLLSPSARDLAAGVVRGNPVYIDIMDRATIEPAEVEEAVASALAREGGEAPFRSTMSALVVRAEA